LISFIPVVKLKFFLYHTLWGNKLLSTTNNELTTQKRRAIDKSGVNENSRGRRHSDQCLKVINGFLSNQSIEQALFSMTGELENLFECEAVSVYAVDLDNRQIYTRNIKSERVDEVRVDISADSLAGFVAATGKALNIKDVQDLKELAQYHPSLKNNTDWNETFNITTNSSLVMPIPYKKKLMGVIQCINHESGNGFSKNNLRQARELAVTLGHAMIKLKVEDILSKIQVTTHAIHAARSTDEVLFELQEPIKELFEVECVTIYEIGNVHKQLKSKVIAGGEITEIEITMSKNSIAGFVAICKKPVKISDVYNEDELKDIDPDIKFDKKLDNKTSVHTKNMLVYPLLHDDQLMGVLQLGNKKKKTDFDDFDIQNAEHISKTIALAFFNQNKLKSEKASKFNYLLERGVISQDELNKAIIKARNNHIDVEAVLLGDFKLKRKDLGKSLESFYGIPYYGYSDTIILAPEIMTGLNRKYLIKNLWIPINSEGETITLLVNDPLDPLLNQSISQIFSKKIIKFKIGTKEDIISFLNSNFGENNSSVKEDKNNNLQEEEMSSLLSTLKDERLDFSSEEEVDDSSNAISESDNTIVRLVNKILIDAYERGVSDIHIEPGVGKDNIMIRFRKDGSCAVYEEIPYIYKQALISRIKIMSKLDIAERRMPQDGKIKMKYGKKEIEYRISTCPTVGGNEDAVMRILAASKPMPLEKMNFTDNNLQLVQNSSTKPFGLILVVGPTGSGKTTTLHSAVGYINKSDKKIWTVEDPVEITQKGLRQVQTHKKIGLDFARAMKSFLRGDPDVIMVGEMRDSETCAIGLEASLTGHLVFSTLHTNSAPETIVRLLDMGMNPLNFADALILIVAQRLVKTLCEECKEPYKPDKHEFEILAREYGEGFDELNIKYSDELTLKRSLGCEACSDTGYSGRTALHECLEGTDEMKKVIMSNSSVECLRIQAVKDGMRTLKQDGICKVFKGDCDLKQVLTVCIV
jgi:type II secretory ATPase GspE/PulE/Tfp pilus assembly ATPase PilB-like protein/transcriptional regulator with GAF, ATPase, and Fis domain